MARTLIIGDVHGCARELEQLLALLGPTEDDRVLFVGDLIARGPDSRAVLSIVRQVRARCVVGNHELRLLEVRRARLRGETGPRLSPHHERLLHQLSESDWALIEAMPLYLDLPEHAARVVHAGMLPGVPLHRQDAWTLTHIRSVDGAGAPSDRPGERPWGTLYEDPTHIVFGHDARRQLQLHPRATGIDTACVYGGSLTALVLPEHSAVPFPQQRRDLLVSVRAAQQYYAPARR